MRFFDVVIIGAGPVGLSAANLLGRAGIATLVLERHPGTTDHPRASGIHGRTMELFRKWGIAGDIRSVAVPENQAQGFGWMTRLNGLELGRLVFADDASGGRCPGHQPGAAVLLPSAGVRAHPAQGGSTTFLGHREISIARSTAFGQDESRAVVGFRRGDRERNRRGTRS